MWPLSLSQIFHYEAHVGRHPRGAVRDSCPGLTVHVGIDSYAFQCVWLLILIQ